MRNLRGFYDLSSKCLVLLFAADAYFQCGFIWTKGGSTHASDGRTGTIRAELSAEI